MTRDKLANEEFNKGEHVAVFGGELDKETYIVDTVILCKVLIVGHSDLVVESSESYMTTRHIVPKSICRPLKLSSDILASSFTLTPQIGDLVVSFFPGYKTVKTSEVSGILFKIVYRLGKPSCCVILCGTEMVTVEWGNLIVLHRD
jgi:hypothetical protein